MKKKTTVFVSGATGFVGRRLAAGLLGEGLEVRCGSRRPARGHQVLPDASWVHFEAQDLDSARRALRGVDVAYFLVHAMAGGPGYAAREAKAAQNFRTAAEQAGVSRIIYLGGVAPQGRPSRHLQSRLQTGRILRDGPVPCAELRAGMIIGAGSASWRICRDVAARLPVLVVPPWLRHKSQPVAIDDVVTGLRLARTMPLDESVLLEVPGPEALDGAAVLQRTARHFGMTQRAVDVPFLPIPLSSHALRLISGGDQAVVRELVEGLTSDLLATGESLWDRVPHQPMGFDAAVRRALLEDDTPAVAQLFERAVRATAGRVEQRLSFAQGR